MKQIDDDNLMFSGTFSMKDVLRISRIIQTNSKHVLSSEEEQIVEVLRAMNGDIASIIRHDSKERKVATLTRNAKSWTFKKQKPVDLNATAR